MWTASQPLLSSPRNSQLIHLARLPSGLAYNIIPERLRTTKLNAVKNEIKGFSLNHELDGLKLTCSLIFVSSLPFLIVTSTL